MADSDFPHLLAGITFHHRCRAKGLCLRSPARRLPRPLAQPRQAFFAPTAAAAGAISRPGASALFVSDGPISSNSGRNGGKNAGRNCVSALPQRAILSCDFPRILAGIAFRHRCRIKGLCLRSPARRLPRPLAPATVDVFAPAAAPPSIPLEWRTPQKSSPLMGSRC